MMTYIIIYYNVSTYVWVYKGETKEKSYFHGAAVYELPRYSIIIAVTRSLIENLLPAIGIARGGWVLKFIITSQDIFFFIFRRLTMSNDTPLVIVGLESGTERQRTTVTLYFISTVPRWFPFVNPPNRNNFFIASAGVFSLSHRRGYIIIVIFRV